VAAVAIMDAAAHLAMADELARAGRYAEALGQRFLALSSSSTAARRSAFTPRRRPAEYVGKRV